MAKKKIGKRIAKSSRALIEELEPSVKRAFNRSIKDLADNVDFGKLRDAIARHNLDDAEEALNLDGAFEELDKVLRRAFEAGGKMTMKIIAEAAAEVRRG